MGPESEVQVYGEGDTYLVQQLLPDEIVSEAFERVQMEVEWQTMHHHGRFLSSNFMVLMTMSTPGGEVPRLVAVEGQTSEDGRRVVSILPLNSARHCLVSPSIAILQMSLHHCFPSPRWSLLSRNT
jgi:hypothetical protein